MYKFGYYWQLFKILWHHYCSKKDNEVQIYRFIQRYQVYITMTLLGQDEMDLFHGGPFHAPQRIILQCRIGKLDSVVVTVPPYSWFEELGINPKAIHKINEVDISALTDKVDVLKIEKERETDFFNRNKERDQQYRVFIETVWKGVRSALPTEVLRALGAFHPDDYIKPEVTTVNNGVVSGVEVTRFKFYGIGHQCVYYILGSLNHMANFECWQTLLGWAKIFTQGYTQIHVIDNRVYSRYDPNDDWEEPEVTIPYWLFWDGNWITFLKELTSDLESQTDQP